MARPAPNGTARRNRVAPGMALDAAAIVDSAVAMTRQSPVSFRKNTQAAPRKAGPRQ
ncbi:hypothetical protein NicSoilB11_23100 [Arthrobacter sp. NicSoilB11]|nr:hypothetical protein NicSoilB11_23100 [Arthrobacter sp. NicSoilB11]